ncbi:MAG TPA: hypothetical protein VGL75_01000 [Acidothermaceae bacterium]|jgi:hypothetical protein
MELGDVLTASDPEPPIGTIVRDAFDRGWARDPEGYWLPFVTGARSVHEPESWVKVAGNYGPATVVMVGALTRGEGGAGAAMHGIVYTQIPESVGSDGGMGRPNGPVTSLHGGIGGASPTPNDLIQWTTTVVEIELFPRSPSTETAMERLADLIRIGDPGDEPTIGRTGLTIRLRYSDERDPARARRQIAELMLENGIEGSVTAHTDTSVMARPW